MAPSGDATVTTAAVSPDGHWVASGGFGQRITLWHLPTSRVWAHWFGHKAALSSISFSPDGKWLASADIASEVLVWSLAGGQLICRLVNPNDRTPEITSPQEIRRVGWLNANTLWAVGSSGVHRIWSINHECSQAKRFAPETEVVWDGYLTQDGWTLATQTQWLQYGTDAKLKISRNFSEAPAHLFKRPGQGWALASRDGHWIEIDPKGRMDAPTYIPPQSYLSQTITPTQGGWIAVEGAFATQVSHGKRLETHLDSSADLVATGSSGIVLLSSDTLTLLDSKTLGVKSTIKVSPPAFHDRLSYDKNVHSLLTFGVGRPIGWDLNAGRPSWVTPLETDDRVISVLDFPDGQHVALLTLNFRGAKNKHYQLKVLNKRTGKIIQSQRLDDDEFIDMKRVGQALFICAHEGLHRFSMDLSERKTWTSPVKPIEICDIDRQGKTAVVSSRNEVAWLDLDLAKPILQWPHHDVQEKLQGHVSHLAISSNGEKVFALSSHHISAIAKDGEVIWQNDLGDRFRGYGAKVAVSQDDQSIVVVGNDIRLFDARDGKLKIAFESITTCTDVAWVNSTRFVTQHVDGVTRVWSTTNGLLAEARANERPGLIELENVNLSWIVATPDGQFDLSDFYDWPDVVWYDDRAPLEALQLEWFAQKSFRPRLMARTINQRDLPQRSAPIAIPKPPTIQAKGVEIRLPQSANRTAYAKLQLKHGSKPITAVKIYVNGLLALHHPVTQPIPANLVVGPIPLSQRGGPLTLEAVALDTDGIRSTPTKFRTELPFVADDWISPTTWIVAIGVNKHENPSFDLSYAANDAALTAAAIVRAKNRRISWPINRVELRADNASDGATKAKIRAAITALKDANRGARVDDDVFISFSGHGIAGADGEYYLVPSDTGSGDSKDVTPELLRKAISSHELSDWLRGIRAKNVTLIIDACHAAAAIRDDQFIPGPMDSPGLAQLAYDQGFAVLVATQADDVALESDKLQQGVLSYALVSEGLDSLQADVSPRDGNIGRIEWLRYATARVPELAEAMKGGTIQAASTSRGVVRADKRRIGPDAQRPTLFWFSRGRHGEYLIWSPPKP